ncbi:MAG: hypothetical protein ACRDSK_31520 [Actinophytocola sp.]|uniref:hypothetical protein n=1 Tax=Actinophytocola sp. TaxID=1872138 RepID=UPI003D6A2E5C
MANTRYLTTAVEDEVRNRLSETHQVAFHKRTLRLQTGGDHEFDAVSDNGRIVASVKTASGRTSGGGHPAGTVVNCIAELYFLTQVRARRRLLVLTSPEFHTIFMRAVQGKIAAGIEIVHIPLPAELQARLSAVQQVANDEVQPVLDPAELRVLNGH